MILLFPVPATADPLVISPASGLRDGKPFDVLISATNGVTCGKQPARAAALNGLGNVVF